MITLKDFSRILYLATCLVTGAFMCVVMPPMAPGAAAQVSLDDAIALHNAGREGDAGAISGAIDMLESLIKSEPGNAAATAYLGSSYAIAARESGSVVDKVRFTNRGLRFLDQAVDMAPDDFAILVMRTNVASNLPPMFGRVETAREDGHALHRIYTQTGNPQMAAHMVGIYEILGEITDEPDKWKKEADAARARAAGR